jgi:hypothetical protein
MPKREHTQASQKKSNENTSTFHHTKVNTGTRRNQRAHNRKRRKDQYKKDTTNQDVLEKEGIACGRPEMTAQRHGSVCGWNSVEGSQIDSPYESS